MVCGAVLMLNHCVERGGKPYEISHPTEGRYPASAPAPWPHSFIHGAINPQEETRTTHTRFGAISLGPWRTTSWCRSAARDTAAGHAPVSRAHRCPCSGPCDDPLEKRHPDLTPAPVRATVPFLLERSLHPARLPGGALLDPTRSRASPDRSAHQSLDRLWDEECRCPHRQARQPAVPAQGQSARRSLSPASAYAHRSKSIVRCAMCCSITGITPRSGAEPTHSMNPVQSPTRSRQFRPLVRRLAYRHRPSEPYRTSPKSPPPEPGSCTPPGAATGSSIPQTFRKAQRAQTDATRR